MSFPTESIPASGPIPGSQPAGAHLAGTQFAGAQPSGPSAPSSQPGRVQYSPSDLLAVLSELADLLVGAKPVLLSKDIRVNRDAALGLIDELRGALPVAVEQADEALTTAKNQLAAAQQQAEATVAAARAEAESVVANGRQRQAELVGHEAVVSQAKARAAEIVAAAQNEADRLMTDADAYCDTSLAQLGKDLASLQSQVAAGRQRLVERHPQLAGQGAPGGRR